jgi:hypothetical protein
LFTHFVIAFSHHQQQKEFRLNQTSRTIECRQDNIIDAVMNCFAKEDRDQTNYELVTLYVTRQLEATPFAPDYQIRNAAEEALAHKLSEDSQFPYFLSAYFPMVTDAGVETRNGFMLVTAQQLRTLYGGENLKMPLERFRMPSWIPGTLEHRLAIYDAIQRHVIEPLQLKPVAKYPEPTKPADVVWLRRRSR